MLRSIVLIENNILATNTIRKRLTLSLIEYGYDITVLTTGTEQELNQARQNGISVIDVKAGHERLLDIYQYIKNLKKALQKIQPDLILTFTFRANIWGNFVARLLKIPVISNITGIGPLFESEKISYKIARVLLRLSLTKTKWVFFQNKDDRDLFLEHKFVKNTKIEIIPGSGVDTEFFAPGNNGIKDNEKKDFSFLFIGRLIKDKGVNEFVLAAQMVKKEFPRAIFSIVGPFWEQNLKSNRITKAELNCWIEKDIIIYEGNADDVRPYIDDADCIVLPSYREGMSNVLLEAGSMAKPCIATNVTGCKEIVEDGITGFLCNPKDANDLAEKMKAMIRLDAKKREEMGIAARKKIKAQFEKQRVIDAYVKAIKKIEARK